MHNSKWKKAIGNFFGFLGNGIIGFFDLFLGSIQKLIGVKGVPYLFVLPNLLIFGIFMFMHLREELHSFLKDDLLLVQKTLREFFLVKTIYNLIHVVKTSFGEQFKIQLFSF